VKRSKARDCEPAAADLRVSAFRSMSARFHDAAHYLSSSPALAKVSNDVKLEVVRARPARGGAS
jgi:hypothetical protein